MQKSKQEIKNVISLVKYVNILIIIKINESSIPNVSWKILSLQELA